MATTYTASSALRRKIGCPDMNLKHLELGSLSFLLSCGVCLAAEGRSLLLHEPTVSATHVAFVHADDLWIVSRAGGAATRLTNGLGPVDDPVFSPDGTSIAFTANVSGNRDVFTIAVTGGEPHRLTFHPLMDRVAGWTPDGKQVLFRSERDHLEFERLYTIPTTGGFARELPLPMAFEGSYSPDGRRLAYVPLRRAFETWKHYRGGKTTPIWIAELATSHIEKIPRDNSNDFQPMWFRDSVYFLSDRDGPITLFAFDIETRRVRRVLDSQGLDIQAASLGPDAIAYEQFGAIYLFDLRSARSEPLRVDFPAVDYPKIHPRNEKVVDSVANVSVSPAGDALFEAHGEIFLAPATGGVRNLTATSGVAERDPAWSPDGRSIAYFSDEAGDYSLHIVVPGSDGPPKAIALGPQPSFFYSPIWSPDGEKIAYLDKHLTLWYVPVDRGAPVRIDADKFGGHFRVRKLRTPVWSPDSRWIAYTKEQNNHLRALYLFCLAEARSYQVTDGMSDVRYPAFDRNGKSLYFTASTDLRSDGGLRQPYLALLDANAASPFRTPAMPDGDREKNATLAVHIQGIQSRMIPLPVPARTYVGLEPGPAGSVFLLDNPPPRPGEPGGQTLYRFDVAERKSTKLLENVFDIATSSDGRKILYQKGRWTVATGGGPQSIADERSLPLGGLEMWVDPRSEWKQIYREALRIERDFFFDPKLRGFDLSAAERRFQPYVDKLVSRADLNYILREIVGHLGTSHVSIDGGDTRTGRNETVGLLGADYVLENGRYRFARIYTGEHWNPGKRVPLVEPGAVVHEGEYLLAINGGELRGSDNIYQVCEGLAGRPVVLRVADDPAGRDSREVTVTPIYNDSLLRYWAWVEDNRRKVDELSRGRVGYMHIPNMDAAGQRSVDRYFFSQTDKEAIIVDARFNSGGSGGLDITDLLQKRFSHYVSSRDGGDQTSPGRTILGPKVLIINEFTASGGDALAYEFHRLGLGPLVGKRTWGGLIGTHLVPQLIDGGQISAPDLASWLPDGSWLLENAGMPPDREVEFDPQAWRAGHDPQLEMAVKVSLETIARNPQVIPKSPPELLNRRSPSPALRAR